MTRLFSFEGTVKGREFYGAGTVGYLCDPNDTLDAIRDAVVKYFHLENTVWDKMYVETRIYTEQRALLEWRKDHPGFNWFNS